MYSRGQILWPIFVGVINDYISKPTLIQGTKDSPTIVHAMDNYRMVGCVCSEEDTNIKWTWLCEVRGKCSKLFFNSVTNIFRRRACPRGASAVTGWSSRLTPPPRSITCPCNLFRENT